jgi:hypothetical protein
MSCNFLVTARILSLRNMRVKTKMCNLRARAMNQQYYGYFGCKYERPLELGQIRMGTTINRSHRILDFMRPIEATSRYTEMPAPVENAGSYAARRRRTNRGIFQFSGNDTFFVIPSKLRLFRYKTG